MTDPRVARPGTTPTLAALHVYPVKSCRGHAVEAVDLDVFGPRGDRRFLVVDERGQFLTQRTLPRLALIEPTLESTQLQLAAPGIETVSIPAVPGPAAPTLEVTIWRDTVAAADLGPTAASWLTTVLGRPARLVAMADAYHRPIRKDTALPGDEAPFSDAFPLLVISEASLEELNGRLTEPVPMNRFRPNVVISGCDAFAEDTWKRIRIGDVVLRAAGPCGRCIVTTIDQASLEQSKEPLRTLAQYRRSADGAVLFGQNYIHETKSGTLRVGAVVEILE